VAADGVVPAAVEFSFEALFVEESDQVFLVHVALRGHVSTTRRATVIPASKPVNLHTRALARSFNNTDW
jgi:hypothetical protein